MTDNAWKSEGRLGNLVGTQAGVAAPLGAGAESNIVDISAAIRVTILGISDTASTALVEYSQDGVTYHGQNNTLTIPAGSFEKTFDVAAKWMRLKNTGGAIANIIATAALKV